MSDELERVDFNIKANENITLGIHLKSYGIFKVRLCVENDVECLSDLKLLRRELGHSDYSISKMF